MQAIKHIFSAITFSCLVFISPRLNGMQKSESTDSISSESMAEEATQNNSPTLRDSLQLLVDANEWRALRILFRVLFFANEGNKTKQITIIKEFLYATVKQETIATMLDEECALPKKTVGHLLQQALHEITLADIKKKFGVTDWEFDKI